MSNEHEIRRSTEQFALAGQTVYADVCVRPSVDEHSVAQSPRETEGEDHSQILALVREVLDDYPGKGPEDWGVHRAQVLERVQAQVDEKGLGVAIDLRSPVTADSLSLGPLELAIDGRNEQLYVHTAVTQRNADLLPTSRPEQLPEAERQCLRESADRLFAELTPEQLRDLPLVEARLQAAVNKELGALGRKLTTLELGKEPAIEGLDDRGDDSDAEARPVFDRYAPHLQLDIEAKAPFGIETITWRGWCELDRGDALGWDYRSQSEADKGVAQLVSAGLRAALKEVCWADIERRTERIHACIKSHLGREIRRRGHDLIRLSGTLEPSNPPPENHRFNEKIPARIEQREVEVEVEVDAVLISALEWRESRTLDLGHSVHQMVEEAVNTLLRHCELPSVLHAVDALEHRASVLEEQFNRELDRAGRGLGYRFSARLHILDPELRALVEGMHTDLFFRVPTRWAEHELSFMARVSIQAPLVAQRSTLMRTLARGENLIDWLREQLSRVFGDVARHSRAAELYAMLDGGSDSRLTRAATTWLREAGFIEAKVDLGFEPHRNIDDYRAAWGTAPHPFDFTLASRLHHHEYQFRGALQMRGLAHTGLERFYRTDNVPSSDEVTQSAANMLKRALRSRIDEHFLREDLEGGDFDELLDKLREAVAEHCVDVFGLDVKLTYLERHSSVEEAVASARRRDTLDAEHNRREQHKLERERRGSTIPEPGASLSDSTDQPRESIIEVLAPEAGYPSHTPQCVFRPVARVVVSHGRAPVPTQTIQALVRRQLRTQIASIPAHEFWPVSANAVVVSKRHAELAEAVECALAGQLEGVRVSSAEVIVGPTMAERLQDWFRPQRVVLEDFVMEGGAFKTEVELSFCVDGIADEGWAPFSRATDNADLISFAEEVVTVYLAKEPGERLTNKEPPADLVNGFTKSMLERFGVEVSQIRVGYSKRELQKLLHMLSAFKLGEDSRQLGDQGKKKKEDCIAEICRRLGMSHERTN